MANELIQFDNLRAVLEEFAGEFRDTYRDSLLKHDRITQHGTDRLVDSVEANDVKAMVTEGDRAFEVTINLKEYWKYVEDDTRPHWPPPSAILRWVEIKPVLPHPDANGRIPSPRSLAYLIGRKISREGTTGSHDFKTAQETTIERFRVRIRVAMVRDVQNYVRQVLAR